MKKTHYYLVDNSSIIPGAAVSELQFNIIHERPFIVHDLQVRFVCPFMIFEVIISLSVKGKVTFLGKVTFFYHKWMSIRLSISDHPNGYIITILSFIY